MAQPTIAVRDLPNLRYRLDRHMDEFLPVMLEGLLKDPSPGAEVYVPRHLEGLPAHTIATELAAAELRRIRLGEMYYVTDEMTQVAMQAGAVMPYYDIRPEDLPSKYGMLVWGEPIGTDSIDTLPITMMTWGLHRAPTGGPGFWVSSYSDRDGQPEPDLKALIPDLGRRSASAKEVERIREQARRHMSFRWAYEREHVIPFGRSEWYTDADGQPMDADRAAILAALPPEKVEGIATTEGYLRTLCAAWLLMGQEVTVTREEEPERAVRRRLARTPTPASPVRVTALRRRSQPRRQDADEPVEAGEGRSYSCRWWVSGHSRNHWFPKEKRHKPIWIEEHLAQPKGTEDAPIKGGERVKVLRR